jgi:hypothetical protein
MKSYTDLEQSKKLAEILPLESADGFWEYHDKGYSIGDEWEWEGYEDYPRAESYLEYSRKENEWKEDKSDVPCWSLSAMLEHLRKHDLFPEIKDADDYILMDITFYYNEVVGKVINPVHFIRAQGKNILDACYEFVLKSHELNLL